LDNAGFTIERSTDGENFIGLGSVEGQGTTSETHQYTFVDKSPLQGLNYYRLRQTDFNGFESFFFVNAVYVHFQSDKGLQVFPTLVTDQLNIAIDHPLEQDGELQVASLLGQIVFSQPLAADVQISTIDLQSLEPGQYVLMIKTKFGGRSAHFLKL